MPKEVITVPTGSKHPLSPATKAGDYIFVSGHVGFVDEKGRVATKGIEAQTRQCLERIAEVLEVAGCSLDDVVKTTVFLVNADDFPKMNEVYQNYFGKGYPARSTVLTGLLRDGALIEIECVAYCP